MGVRRPGNHLPERKKKRGKRSGRERARDRTPVRERKRERGVRERENLCMCVRCLLKLEFDAPYLVTRIRGLLYTAFNR